MASSLLVDKGVRAYRSQHVLKETCTGVFPPRGFRTLLGLRGAVAEAAARSENRTQHCHAKFDGRLSVGVLWTHLGLCGRERSCCGAF